MNKRNTKINICLVAGGKSTEQEVSINSAKAILKNLDPKKYNISLLGITISGTFSYLSTAELHKIKKIGQPAKRKNWIEQLNSIENSNQLQNVNIFLLRFYHIFSQ